MERKIVVMEIEFYFCYSESFPSFSTPARSRLHSTTKIPISSLAEVFFPLRKAFQLKISVQFACWWWRQWRAEKMERETAWMWIENYSSVRRRTIYETCQIQKGAKGLQIKSFPILCNFLSRGRAEEEVGRMLIESSSLDWIRKCSCFGEHTQILSMKPLTVVWVEIIDWGWESLTLN